MAVSPITAESMSSDALIMIGAEPIVDFDDGSSGATVAGNLYEDLRNSLLSEHSWHFCKAEAELSKLLSTPLGEWEHAYQLPPDFLAVRHVSPTVRYYDLYEGSKIYMDYDSVASGSLPVLTYTTNPPEENWPLFFRQAMKEWLALNFIIPVRDDSAMFDRWNTRWERIRLPKFRRIDAKQKINERLGGREYTSPIVRARGGVARDGY
jgi:hypothetical protein